jgi:hypothetical protein
VTAERTFRLGLWRRVLIGMGTLALLVRTTWTGPYWFLVPFSIVLGLLSLLFVLAATMPVIAPFVYAIF